MGLAELLMFNTSGSWNAGQLRMSETFSFAFENTDMRYESYEGSNVQLIYFVRVTVQQRVGKIDRKFPFWVHKYEATENAEVRNALTAHCMAARYDASVCTQCQHACPLHTQGAWTQDSLSISLDAIGCGLRTGFKPQNVWLLYSDAACACRW